uniref:SPIN-DOC-like zinc-finger domain-containing protein n=1 Tax=Leptobrachium leishanense TaxID=445787 RepID=A0A8C5M4S6_9ANUR
MSAHIKKRKIDTECRVFNKTWTLKYFFTEVKGKAVCLVCGVQIAVFKEYNLSRHYVTKHAEKYKNVSDAERARASNALLTKLQNQQELFTKLHTSRDGAVKTSYVISTKSQNTASHFLMGNLSKSSKSDREKCRTFKADAG